MKRKIIGHQRAPWNHMELVPIYQLTCNICDKPIDKPFSRCCSIDIVERLRQIEFGSEHTVALIKEAADEIERLTATLVQIANTDYRGNRSQESITAHKAVTHIQ